MNNERKYIVMRFLNKIRYKIKPPKKLDCGNIPWGLHNYKPFLYENDEMKELEQYHIAHYHHSSPYNELHNYWSRGTLTWQIHQIIGRRVKEYYE